MASRYDPSFLGFLAASDHLKKPALAASAWPNQADGLTTVDSHGDSRRLRHHGHALESEDRLHYGRTSSSFGALVRISMPVSLTTTSSSIRTPPKPSMYTPGSTVHTCPGSRIVS